MLRRLDIALWRSRWLQAALLMVAWWGCEALSHALALPVSGGILALFLLTGLLLSGRLPLNRVRRGAAGLLDHMVLFFVPAVMALMNHRELLGWVGLKLLLVIALSTVAVMVGTALVVDRVIHWGARDAA